MKLFCLSDIRETKCLSDGNSGGSMVQFKCKAKANIWNEI